MTSPKAVACVKDFESTAQQRIGSKAWDYYRSGADTEHTLRENEAAFQRYRFRPRVLRDVSKIDLSTTILGASCSMPICLAPSAMQKMASERGELDTARAASTKGTVMVLSTLSTTSIEDVAHEYSNWSTSRGSLWFQLYIYKDREITKRLIRRAEEAGFKALCLTVDTPYLGNRRADARNRFEMPAGLRLANFADAKPEMVSGQANKDSWLLEYTQSLFDASISWKDIAWLRGITKLKIVLKGIVTAEDAELAVNHGVDGILVSNHGGRQLDGAPATLDVLAEVVAAVKGSGLSSQCEVYLDGGVRTGTDVVKALALGAKAVFLGRPVLWGLAHSGAAGVESVLAILEKEMRSTMGLLGATKVSEVTANMVAPVYPSKL